MQPESRAASPSARRTSEITFARLFSSTTTSGQSASSRNSLSSKSPRRSTSNSSASKQRGNIASGLPACTSWRRAGSSRRPANSYMTCASSFTVLSEQFRTRAGHSGEVWAILSNMEATLNARNGALAGKQGLIFFAAGVGFAFDMYEIVVQATIVRPLLTELGPFQPGTALFNQWRGLFLFLPAVVGGLTALGGGYLTDRIGRQRVLVWSIVLYAIAAFMSGFSSSLYEVMFWRCITVAGSCVEFVAAIAWLTELYPDPKRRESMLGYAQVCATVGNFMIA